MASQSQFTFRAGTRDDDGFEADFEPDISNLSKPVTFTIHPKGSPTPTATFSDPWAGRELPYFVTVIVPKLEAAAQAAGIVK